MVSWLVLIGALSIGAVSIVHYYRTKKVLVKMNGLLDQAINGEPFYEDYTDTYEDKLIEKLKTFIQSRDLQSKKAANENQNVQALISNIAHQTKTPITNISIFSELLKETTNPAAINDYVSDINTQAAKLNHLIEELMKTSYLENKLIQITKEQSSFHQLLEDVLASFQQVAQQKGVQFQIDSFPEIEGCFDEKWTKEALSNLIDNGIKYGAADTTIEITFQRFESFDCLSVTNTGTGISEEEQGKIFQRFYRGASTTAIEGLGIGLYLVRNIMQLQGGFVKLESANSRNTFSLFFKR